ncbi:MAG: hypothetical protein ACLTMP_02680 [Eggerthella lenta]
MNVLFRLSSENQFGVDSATLKELIAGCKDDPFISIQGIQYYSGTQKTSLKKLDRELNKLHRIVAEVEAACSVKLNEIEYGPGLPVEYSTRTRAAAARRTNPLPSLQRCWTVSLSRGTSSSSWDAASQRIVERI